MNEPIVSTVAVLLFTAFLSACAAFAARRAGINADLSHPISLAMLGVGCILQALVAGEHHGDVSCWAELACLAAVTVSAATDACSGYVFDVVTVPAFAAIVGIAFLTGHFSGAFSGALAAGGAMAALYTITLGRGLGLGDVKLACCIGAALGVYDGLLALGAAFVLGGVYAAYGIATRHLLRGQAVAFAPYLAAGTVALSLYRIAP